MCMIFRNPREPVKQIGIWLGVLSLLPLATWYGTSAFSPPPDAKEHYKKTSRLEEKIKEAVNAEQKEKLRQEKDRIDKEFDEAEKAFYQDMFWVAYPVGLVAVIIGILLPVQTVGSGLLFGGIITLGIGCYSFWDTMDAWLRFGSLVLVLFVLVILGTWRFWRPRPTPQ
jgi:hypothetical protein